MKINFDDTSYIEISFAPTPGGGKVTIVLSAKDGTNAKKNIVNSAEISKEQFLQMIEEVTSTFDM